MKKFASKTVILATALLLPTLSYAVGPPKVSGEQDPSLYFPPSISIIPSILSQVTWSTRVTWSTLYDDQFLPVFGTTTPSGQLKNYAPSVISNQADRGVSPPVGRQAGIEPSEDAGAATPHRVYEAM